MGRLRFPAVVAPLILLGGCHSPYVSAEIRNQTPAPVTLVELDYPTASFGTQSLAPGQTFRYRFKVLGSGELRLLWTDNHRVDRHADGPHLDEGAEGGLLIAITPTGVQWTPSLRAGSGHP